MENFSKKYYKNANLTLQQHKANNEWFAKMIEECKLHRKKLYVPNIRTWFDCDGKEIKADSLTSIEKIGLSNQPIMNL